MKLTSLRSTALVYFLEVAQKGSVSAAARSLHVAISAISRQIARLEADLGMPLFYRHSQGMVLTPAGHQVRQHARRAALDAEALHAQLRSLQGLESSTVKLACTDGFSPDYLPAVIAQFRALHPGVSFTLEVCGPTQASTLVREGTVDIALTFTLAPQEDINVAYAEAAPVYAHVAQTHPLACDRRADMHEIVKYPVVLPTPPHIVRQLFDLCCSLNGLQANMVLTSNSLAALTGYLRYDEAVNFCGSLSVRNRLRVNRQVLVEITNPEMAQRVLQVQTMAGRALSPAAHSFVLALVMDIRKRRRGVSRGRPQ